MSNERSSGARTARPRYTKPFSEIRRAASGGHKIRLAGEFRTGFLVSLCAGLAERRISIEQAHARREHDGAWIAELKVKPLPGAVDPKLVPCLEIAQNASPALCPMPKVLTDYRVADTFAHGGTLRLELEAPDALGLLGGLLSALAQLRLHPIELNIATRAGRAYDTLWLVTDTGHPPTAMQRAAVLSMLDRSKLP